MNLTLKYSHFCYKFTL